MAADRLTRAGGAPQARFGSMPVKAGSAFTEARKVHGQTAYVPRDGAAHFDKHAGLPGCDLEFFHADLDIDLGSRLKSFFRSLAS